MAFEKAVQLKKIALPLSDAEHDPLLQIIRSELNIHRFIGLFATSHFKGKSRTLTRETKFGKVEIVIGRTFDSQRKEVEIDVLKVPHYKVLEALILLWERAGKPAGDVWVQSSRRELTNTFGKSWGGKTSKYLLNYLTSLSTIPIQWKRFFLKDHGYVDLGEKPHLHFIELDLLRKFKHGKELDWRFKFRFDKRIHNNLAGSYTKPFHFEVIAPLSEISTLVYVHADLVMAHRDHYVRRSEGLFEDLGLMQSVRNHKPSIRYQLLQSVVKELYSNPVSKGQRGTIMSTGILTNVQLEKAKHGSEWNIRFVKQPFQKAAPHRSAALIEQLFRLQVRAFGSAAAEQNRGFYYRIAQRGVPELIQTAITDTRDEHRSGNIEKDLLSFYGYWVQSLHFRRGIDLGFKSSFSHLKPPSLS